ncbi:RNA polymerase sigma factor [Rossellomorea sp. SC111]|uniref:RNA polymerase sigma factor n=1 Tax=Rossellomorea sp. SC111 TaxID=2968985 RepID=UPI00215A3EAE|nr:RNA polymerase sigma factor [Rossellomorea sp. SC111]MCR8848441.1 RNA polymerase sigma factor [Rossellomorea sp. SC111]
MTEDYEVKGWFREYYHDIFNFLIYYTGTKDVEDLVQETFVKAVRNIDRFKGDSNPKTWLIRIARNAAIDESRKRRKEETKRNRLIGFTGLEMTRDLPEIHVELNETKLELYTAIRLLKQSYYDVLMLRGINELSVQETAETLRWSEAKVNLTFHRALKALEKKMGGKAYE